MLLNLQRILLQPFMNPLLWSGERHLVAATVARVPPKIGDEIMEVMELREVVSTGLVGWGNVLVEQEIR